MKKTIVILSIVLGTSLVGAGALSVFFVDKNEKVKTSNKEFNEQESIIENNQKQVDELKKRLSDNEIEIKQLEAYITTKDNEIKKLNKKYANKKQAEEKAKREAATQKKINERNNKIKDALQVPSSATCNVKIGEKYFWEGAGMNVISVSVEGTGKYKGYFACADFTLDYSEACTGIHPWSKD